MAERGVLPAEARVELLDGQIIDMPPIGPSHGGATNRLNFLFSQLSQGRWIVAVQNPVHLDAHSAPQPDIMLLRPVEDFYARCHPAAQDVFLLIEVADTSLAYDREEKLPAYGRAGIPEVWILNLNERALEIYRKPHLTGYGSRTVLCAGDKASPSAFPDVSLEVAQLLTQARAKD